VGRLWVEALRIDPASQIFGVRVNIWVSLVAAAAALAWLAFSGREREASGRGDVEGQAG
jgi:prolipoprotein diacylglyceryltransferase